MTFPSFAQQRVSAKVGDVEKIPFIQWSEGKRRVECSLHFFCSYTARVTRNLLSEVLENSTKFLMKYSTGANKFNIFLHKIIMSMYEGEYYGLQVTMRYDN
jgi:hypothetical protein